MDSPTLTGVKLRGVAQRLVEKRLSRNTTALNHFRRDLQLLDEQLDALREDARDKELRSLVSETPLALHEFHEADKHVVSLSVQREHIVNSIASLARQQDDLLDKLGGGS